MNDQIYGLDRDDALQDSPEEVLERWIGDNGCDTFEAAASHKEWPMKVYVFKRMNHWRDRVSFAENYLERILEDLDEEYGDPEGDATRPSDAMKRAALAFVDSVFKEYEPWNCERTKDFVLITREEADERWKELTR